MSEYSSCALKTCFNLVKVASASDEIDFFFLVDIDGVINSETSVIDYQ